MSRKNVAVVDELIDDLRGCNAMYLPFVFDKTREFMLKFEDDTTIYPKQSDVFEPSLFAVGQGYITGYGAAIDHEFSEDVTSDDLVVEDSAPWNAVYTLCKERGVDDVALARAARFARTNVDVGVEDIYVYYGVYGFVMGFCDGLSGIENGEVDYLSDSEEYKQQLVEHALNIATGVVMDMLYANEVPFDAQLDDVAHIEYKDDGSAVLHIDKPEIFFGSAAKNVLDGKEYSTEIEIKDLSDLTDSDDFLDDDFDDDEDFDGEDDELDLAIAKLNDDLVEFVLKVLIGESGFIVRDAEGFEGSVRTFTAWWLEGFQDSFFGDVNRKKLLAFERRKRARYENLDAHCTETIKDLQDKGILTAIDARFARCSARYILDELTHSNIPSENIPPFDDDFWGFAGAAFAKGRRFCADNGFSVSKW